MEIEETPLSFYDAITNKHQHEDVNQLTYQAAQV